MADDTERHARRAPRLSEDTQVLVKLGSLISCAVALVTATIFVWQMKTDAALGLAEARAFREEMKPILEQHRRLWWDYELRTAARSGSGGVGP